MTITGKTIAEELKDVPAKPRSDQQVIFPIDKALYAEGHLAILKGNLAEDGAVAKITGLKNPVITGPARVFDDEQSALEAILADKIVAGDVVVLRYLGPKGGPGMSFQLFNTLFSHIGTLNTWPAPLTAATPGLVYLVLGLVGLKWVDRH